MDHEKEIFLKKISSLFSVNPNGLLNLPCHVFWKDTNGIYLQYNDYGAAGLGFNSGNEIVGHTDFELFAAETAIIFTDNDKKVICFEKEMFFREHAVIKKTIPVVFFSHKIPLYDFEKNLVGLLGIALVRRLSFVNNKFSEKNFCAVSPSIIAKSTITKNFHLSERERECIQYLCSGFSIKQIARKLNVSPRTIETYIERSKNKLGCVNKADLIIKFTNLFNSNF